LLTSEEPKRQQAQHPAPQTDTPPTDLSHEAWYEEQLLKFSIGLRLLGEKKRERFLQYMATRQERSIPRETAAQKEGQE